jgi:hypothetical protein
MCRRECGQNGLRHTTWTEAQRQEGNSIGGRSRRAESASGGASRKLQNYARLSAALRRGGFQPTALSASCGRRPENRHELRGISAAKEGCLTGRRQRPPLRNGNFYPQRHLPGARGLPRKSRCEREHSGAVYSRIAHQAGDARGPLTLGRFAPFVRGTEPAAGRGGSCRP